jgi:hypothetical protein
MDLVSIPSLYPPPPGEGNRVAVEGDPIVKTRGSVLLLSQQLFAVSPSAPLGQDFDRAHAFALDASAGAQAASANVAS